MRDALLRVAAARVEGFFLETVAAGPHEPLSSTPPVGPRPVIAVFGLARRCGATVVARALAAELAGRDGGGTAAVASDRAVGGLPIATAAAGKLAESLADVPGARTTAIGRLCLVEGARPMALADTARHLAPLVLDAGSDELDAEVAAIADRALLVTAPAVEPALVAVAAGCLPRGGAAALVVSNRVRRDGHPGEQAPRAGKGAKLSLPSPLVLPESRMGAQLALGGRPARGALGRAIAALADRCEVVA